MSINQRYKKILENQKFHELVKKRSVFAWKLSSVILIVYYTFILTIAFFPALLGRPISTGMITTIGIPIGIFIIFLSFVLTGLYVWRANTEFDKLTKELLKESV